MPTLLDVAVSFAYRVGAQTIITGVSDSTAEPGSSVPEPYPDNRREFILNYQHMLDSALPKSNRIVIETPLVDFDRSEIVKLGARLKVPFESTWSC